MAIKTPNATWQVDSLVYSEDDIRKEKIMEGFVLPIVKAYYK